MRILGRLLLGASPLAFLGACAVTPEGRDNGWRATERALSDAAPAPADHAIFRIEYDQGLIRVRCSGVLLAPNLIATAAHCLTGQSMAVDCDGPAPPLLGPLLPASGFKVTTAANLRQGSAAEYGAVKKVHLLTDFGVPLCGNDVGVLQLSETVSITPLTPLFAPPEVGTSYSAYGYGADTASGTGDGVRRELAGRSVICVGSGCEDTLVTGLGGQSGTSGEQVPAPAVRATEFLGGDGVCAGDSGGPAVLKRANLRRVLGVVSRGRIDCSAPVYAIFPAELRAVGRSAALEGGYAAPSWTREPTQPPENEPVPQPEIPPSTDGEGGASTEPMGATDSTGCQLQASGARGVDAWLLALLGIGLLVARRGRTRVARAALVSFGTFLAGCDVAAHNTEGQTFSAVCEDQRCALNWMHDGQSVPYAIHESSRILTACPASDLTQGGPRSPDALSSVSEELDCRPLVCEGERECTTLGGSEFSCVRQICQATQRPLSPRDVMSLCLAGTGPFTRKPSQIERLSFARSGARLGQVPAACRQP